MYPGVLTEAQAERILRRLEKKYDKATAPEREYYSDLKDIQNLLTAEKIDKGHALILVENAKAKLKQEQEKRRDKDNQEEDKPTKIVAPVGVGSVIGAIINLIIFVPILIFLLSY